VMDFVQELWQTLNLIDDDQMVLRGELLGDTSWVPTKGQKDRAVQKVIHPRFF